MDGIIRGTKVHFVRVLLYEMISLTLCCLWDSPKLLQIACVWWIFPEFFRKTSKGHHYDYNVQYIWPRTSWWWGHDSITQDNSRNPVSLFYPKTLFANGTGSQNCWKDEYKYTRHILETEQVDLLNIYGRLFGGSSLYLHLMLMAQWHYVHLTWSTLT